MIELEVLINLATILLMTWAVMTQIVIPIIYRTRLFPVFSRRSHGLVDEIAAVDQEIEAEHLVHELAHKRAELTKEQTHEQ